MSVTGSARQPKQQRSQRSFARVLQASAEILASEGYDGFTLGKVSARSGVSTGSIYGRISTKDDLVHIVHERELEQLVAEHEALIESLSGLATLTEVVPRLVRQVAALMRRHAPLLRPLMLRAGYDEAIRARGKATADAIRADVVALLMAHRGEINHPDPEQAADVCYTMMYAVVARYLGLGAELQIPDGSDWDETVEVTVDIFLRGLGANPA